MSTIKEVSAATLEEAEERKQNFLIDDPSPWSLSSKTKTAHTRSVQPIRKDSDKIRRRKFFVVNDGFFSALDVEG